MDNKHVPYGVYEKYIKRILDFICALAALIVLCPVYLLLIILILIIMKGNPFFTQKRAGKNEIPFKMIKFRTMTNECDADGELLPDTERFTRFGDILRKTSLDELPELINVLKGDMSLVGPRPLYTFYVPFYTEEESHRHDVRGGITGLAQINGRALCRWKDRFAYDVQYVNHITFSNDVKILWKTVYNVLKKSDIGIPSVTDEGGLHKIRELQRSDKVQEIGSSFSLSKNKFMKSEACPLFVDEFGYENKYYYSVGRSCIKAVLDNFSFEGKVVLVPPFTCESVIEPFEKKSFKVIPYAINRDFSLDLAATEKLIKKYNPDIIIFHDYFGFNTTKGLKKLLDSCKNIVVINDATQSMFSDFNTNWTDYCLGSIRKWGPLPDGAFLLSNCKKYDSPKAEDKELVDLEIEAMSLKQEYIETHKGDKNQFLAKFADIRGYIDNQKQSFCMSEVSNAVFEKMETEGFCGIRKNNYSVLFESLKDIEWIDIPLGPVTEGIVPFMFPIFVNENRTEFQKFLARNNVYATVIWSCPEIIANQIDATSKSIYDEILCIPCDQRYNADDMNYISTTIRKYKELNH